MIPVGSFSLDTGTDLIIRETFSDEGQCVGKVCLGLITFLIMVSGNVLAHPPKRGERGKGCFWRHRWDEEAFGYLGLMFPVDPNEFGKGEVSLRALVFFFSVSEPRASAEAIVGIGSRIATKFSKKESFLLQTEGIPKVYPDLEVMGRGFDNHASGFEGTIGPFMMGAKQRIGQVIGQQIGFRVLGLNEDMSSLGVLCLEVWDESGFGLNDPAAFFKVEDRQVPVGLKIPVEFLKDLDHDC